MERQTFIALVVGFVAGFVAGVYRAVAQYHRAFEEMAAEQQMMMAGHPPAPGFPDHGPVVGGQGQPQNDPQDADLDPNIHGEFRGPDNPAPGTQRWFELKADELISELQTTDPTEIAQVFAMRNPGVDLDEAEEAIRERLGDR